MIIETGFLMYFILRKLEDTMVETIDEAYEEEILSYMEPKYKKIRSFSYRMTSIILSPLFVGIKFVQRVVKIVKRKSN
jgi:hypothetical protein